MLEYTLVAIPLYVSIICFYYYSVIVGIGVDGLFILAHSLAFTIAYVYLVSKCRNGYSISFMLRFRGIPGPLTLSLFFMYSVILSLLIIYLSIEMAEGRLGPRGSEEYIISLLSTIGIRTPPQGIAENISRGEYLTYNFITNMGPFFETYITLLGASIALFGILFYSSSEFLGGDFDLFIHRHMLKSLLNVFRKSKNKIVVSGYGFLGKAVVKGIFEYMTSIQNGDESKNPYSGIELGYTIVWNQRNRLLELRSIASNILIISRDSEEWDYRVEHPVYKNIGAEEIEHSLGLERSLVLVLGPNIRSDFLLKQSGSYDAKVFVHTFRSRPIETFLYTRFHTLRAPEFRSRIAIRATSALSYAIQTSADLEGRIHKYYTEYIFGNLLLRRLYSVLLEIAERNKRNKGKGKTKRVVVIPVGRGKTLYYMVKSLLVLLSNSELWPKELGVIGDIVTGIHDNKTRTYMLDSIIISPESEKRIRSIPLRDFRNLPHSAKYLNVYKMINSSPLLLNKARIYVAPIRHLITPHQPGRKQVYNLVVIHIDSLPDESTILLEILRQALRQDIIPVFVVSSFEEGENIHCVLEILKAWSILKKDEEFHHEERDSGEKEFYIITSILQDEEYLKLLEIAKLYNLFDKTFYVNVYRTVKESLCSYILLVARGQ